MAVLVHGDVALRNTYGIPDYVVDIVNKTLEPHYGSGPAYKAKTTLEGDVDLISLALYVDSSTQESFPFSSIPAYDAGIRYEEPDVAGNIATLRDTPLDTDMKPCEVKLTRMVNGTPHSITVKGHRKTGPLFVMDELDGPGRRESYTVVMRPEDFRTPLRQGRENVNLWVSEATNTLAVSDSDTVEVFDLADRHRPLFSNKAMQTDEFGEAYDVRGYFQRGFSAVDPSEGGEYLTPIDESPSVVFRIMQLDVPLNAIYTPLEVRRLIEKEINARARGNIVRRNQRDIAKSYVRVHYLVPPIMLVMARLLNASRVNRQEETTVMAPAGEQGPMGWGLYSRELSMLMMTEGKTVEEITFILACHAYAHFIAYGDVVDYLDGCAAEAREILKGVAREAFRMRCVLTDLEINEYIHNVNHTLTVMGHSDGVALGNMVPL
jgi:hypothetical protein